MCAPRYRSVAEARGFGIGIGVKRSLRKSIIAWPEAGAADLMRIGFAGDRVRQPGDAAGVERSRPSRETGHSEVEAAPKEMNRARLAQKASAKKLKDAIGLDQRAPKVMGGDGVIRRVGAVLRKADRVGYLVRHLMDGDGDPDTIQEFDHALIEVGNSLRPK